MCVYIHIYIYVYICIYVYTYLKNLHSYAAYQMNWISILQIRAHTVFFFLVIVLCSQAMLKNNATAVTFWRKMVRIGHVTASKTQVFLSWNVIIKLFFPKHNYIFNLKSISCYSVNQYTLQDFLHFWSHLMLNTMHQDSN